MYDYSSQDVLNSLIKLGIKKGDNIFCHSNTFLLGSPKGILSKKNIYKTIIEGFKLATGQEGTVFFPAFTYSFTKKKIFDLKMINKDNGILSEMCIKSKESFRSLDPNFSVVGVGKNCKNFIKNLSENSYDENSFFSRFVRANGKICNININSVNIFIHYFERLEKVNYRFDKTFTGKIMNNKKLLKKKSKIFVRKKINPSYVQSLNYFDLLCKNNKIYKMQKLGRGFISVMKLKEMGNLINKELNIDPYFLTKLGKNNF